MGYRFVTHNCVPHLYEQLTELTNRAFAEYEGAPTVGVEFSRWYAQRPGSSPDICVAALDGDRMVANVLVALQDVNLGGEFVPCGIVDTVATHPDHRRQGLAHRLMDMAHDLMREHGAAAGVLYTNPANHPYHFYARLGYATRAQAAMLTGERPERTGSYAVRPMRADETPLVRRWVNDRYGGYEGFARLNEALWQWHRVERPAGMPMEVVVAERGGQVMGTAALAPVQVLRQGRQTPVAVVSDVVYPDVECLRDLLAAAPAAQVMALHDVKSAEHAALEAVGLQSAVGEVAMVLPLGERARGLLQREAGPWYVMVESVVGV